MVVPSSASIRSKLSGSIASMHHEHPAFKWWILATVMIGTFMAVLDATIVNVALNKIMASFCIPVEKAEWVLTAYMLVMAVMR